MRKALLVPVRYSARMLAALEALVRAGKLGFCETRAPSLCAAEPSWCTAAGMRSLRPDLFSPRFGCCNNISAHALLTRRRQWAALPEGRRPSLGRLVHRIVE